jgi:predicted TIM-barrel fold metal-dependent hydrolase
MHNDYIIESIKQYPERLIGFSCFSLLSRGSAMENEVLRSLENGLRGVGELALYESDIDSNIIKNLVGMMEICKQRSIPVLFHTNEPIGHSYPGKLNMDIKSIHSIVSSFPENKIVLAHWGGGIFFYQLLKKEVKEVYKNVWFDTAASPYLYTPKIYSLAVQIIGYEKIVFGSDYPLILPSRYLKELESSGLNEIELQAILYQNASKILELEES